MHPLRRLQTMGRCVSTADTVECMPGVSAGQEAWLEAWTELKNGQFAYRVLSERGSDTVRSRVLHAVLEREQELINEGNTDKADLTPENYEFGDAERDADGSQSVTNQAAPEGRAPRRRTDGPDP